VSELEFQTWICPICCDDHPSDRPCEDLHVREHLLNLLLLKRSVDGFSGRPWDAGKHLEYDTMIEDILKRIVKGGGR
jgi:hypothetical protein